jgi:nitrate reductase beta subunit
VVPVRTALTRLAAMRSYMRELNLGTAPDEPSPEIEDMYRLLAIAKYEERYVIPTAAMADAHAMEEAALATGCSVDYDSTGGQAEGEAGPFGDDSGKKALPLISLENFHAMRRRQTADREDEV